MSDNSFEHIKVFSFKSFDEVQQKEETLNIKIIEKLQASYSSYTWPSAPILALYLWEHKSELNGKYILELGAGTALPGIVAAKCGAYVTLSESVLLPKSIQNLKRTCELNDLHANQIQVVGLTWGLFTSSIFKLKPLDLIVGSDCFYEPAVFEDILTTVAFLIERNPQAEFLTTYQERSSDWSIEHLLNKWNLCCSTVSTDNLGSESGLDINDLMRDHTIHLLKIRRKY